VVFSPRPAAIVADIATPTGARDARFWTGDALGACVRAGSEAMLRAIEGLRGKRTVVIVTHRTEPLAIADVVVRLAARAARRDSDRQDAQDRPGEHADAGATEELSVEDVGVAVGAEVEREVARERIDVPGAE
jgi:hypothetical protein